MKNKNYFIYLISIIVIAVVVFFVYFLQGKNKVANNNIEKNNVQSDPIENVNVVDSEINDVSIPSTFGIEKIANPKELDASQISILESSNFSIPKDVEGIEMMSGEEKELLGLDPELNIQVLGRDEEGNVTGYQFIYSEEDFILDLR